jgi:5-methylcytosine-specific restriction enzyme A
VRVFFHHVGKTMADRDFPRTVFNDVDIATVEHNIPRHIRGRDSLLQQLHRAFPAGRFNAWGVPAGARQAISHLSPGDYFLLLGLAGLHGLFPAMGGVRAFVPEDLLTLSNAFWGEERFPLIFFFQTERIHYSWPDFTDDVEYKGNFRPAGQVYAIQPARLEKFGGPTGYVQHVRARYGDD